MATARAARREAAQVAADLIAERMLNVMGVVRVCRAVRVAKEASAAIETAAELAGGRPGTFAVRARRRDKRFGVTSAELAIAIGSRIQSQFGNPVDLRHPDFTIYVEVDQSEIFVYTDGLAGQGGLPVGMSGRGAGAAVRRHRLAGRCVPDDAPRAVLQLPALLRHAADRARVRLQGVRPGPSA